MNDKIRAVYTVQKIDNYYVVAISSDIYKALRVQDDKFRLIVKQDKVVLQGQRLQRRPWSSTTDLEVDAIVL